MGVRGSLRRLDVECFPNHLISVVRSSRGMFFAAQYRLQSRPREAVCTELQTLLTSRRAPPFSLVTKSHQVSCSACATVPQCHATAKVRSKASKQASTLACNTQEAKSPKAAPKQQAAKASIPKRPLTRSASARALRSFARASRCKHKKPFLVQQHQVTSSGGRYNIRQPAFGARRLPRASGRGRDTARLVAVLRATHDLNVTFLCCCL